MHVPRSLSALVHAAWGERPLRTPKRCHSRPGNNSRLILGGWGPLRGRYFVPTRPVLQTDAHGLARSLLSAEPNGLGEHTPRPVEVRKAGAQGRSGKRGGQCRTEFEALECSFIDVRQA